MTKKRKQRRARSRQAILVALLLSLLLHQVILTGLSTIFDFSKPKPEERHEVTLRETPKPEEPEQEKIAKKKPAPAPTPPKPKRPLPQIKTPPKPPTPPSPTPSQESAVAEAPTVVPPEGPVATAPEPTPKPAPTPPDLDLSWRSFEKIFGAKAEQEREEYAQQSLEKRRGNRAFANYSPRVQRALRNNQSFIKPGQQEVLGSRQKTFHNYIHAIHEASIHPLFADSFLRSLPSLSPNDPLNDWSLNMVAEFEIFENGQISEIRVVKSSGNHVFDAGAIDAIYRSSPFPQPPKSVLSWNRRVYLRWGFYRNNRKCGVFNVEPYILKAPGAKEEQLPVDKFTIIDG